jgi:predicted ribonuclease YlaK
MTTKPKRAILGPSSERQKVFLTDDSSDLVFYGGGAGAGKSYCALLRGLRGINDKNFRALYVRNTYNQLTSPGK